MFFYHWKKPSNLLIIRIAWLRRVLIQNTNPNRSEGEPPSWLDAGTIIEVAGSGTGSGKLTTA